MAEEGTGEVLQRLLQLSNAPFLALSATVGHPEVFHGWLQDVSKGRRDVLLVQARTNVNEQRCNPISTHVHRTMAHSHTKMTQELFV